MREAITNYLPWLLSLTTILAIELQGRKWPNAWAFSLGWQVLWFTWIAVSRQWGFLPLTSITTAQYVRNHLRWRLDGPRSASSTRSAPGAREG